MFGKNLKYLRNSKGLTQAQLADCLNISTSAIGMYEQGRREPDNEMLKKICISLNTSIDYLLGLEKFQKIENMEVDDFIDKFADNLRTYPALMFNGFPVSSSDREKIVSAIKIATAVVVYDSNNVAKKKT